jgi:hypothetical protein
MKTNNCYSDVLSATYFVVSCILKADKKALRFDVIGSIIIHFSIVIGIQYHPQPLR